MGSSELSERSRRLLAALVREYVETGEPVSSSVLARESRLGVSSATIRNSLVRLEEAGYVHQPHTSAGRVPTDRGYRLFVDGLLDGRRPGRAAIDVEVQLRQQAERSLLVDDLLANVSHLVSLATRHVGFALSESNVATLQRIEFVHLGGSRVLVVVVSDGQQVTQKAVDAGEEVRPQDLVQAANYLNTEFAGVPLVEVRRAVLGRLQEARTLYDALRARALRLARQTLEELPASQAFRVEGVSRLGDSAEDDVSRETLRALLELMEEKERLLHLLNQYLEGPGLTVVIGEELGTPSLQHLSLVASTAVDGSTTRTVGVIGPTRMHYRRTIALVEGTSQAVSRVLRNTH
jgi:heat-inducible transcriptional repressor